MARKSTTLYFHNSIKGCVSQSRCRASGTTISIYHAAQAMLDEEGGPWVTVCEDHGCLCNHTSLALARQHAASPEWCEECCIEREIRQEGEYVRRSRAWYAAEEKRAMAELEGK